MIFHLCCKAKEGVAEASEVKEKPQKEKAKDEWRMEGQVKYV